MRVVFLLCAAFALSVAAADPEPTMMPAVGTTVTPGDSGEISCPPDFHRHEQRCFRFVHLSMNWIDAEKHCWSQDANLASIHNVLEYSFIHQLMRNRSYDGMAWIGGKHAFMNKNWFWIDGSEFDLPSWTLFNPAFQYKWKECLTAKQPGYTIVEAKPCKERYPFICASEPAGPV